jgi:hypothetical protein
MGSNKAKWKKETSHTAGPAEPDSLGATYQSSLPQTAPILGREQSTRPAWDDFKHFTPRDFACQCAGLCDHPIVISLETVAKLDKIRDVIGLPIRVLSGTRCERYNTRVSGKSRSAHVPKNGVSHAAHVSCPDSSFRYAFLAAALPLFNRIGIEKDFFHVDDDPELPAKVVWICGK